MKRRLSLATAALAGLLISSAATAQAAPAYDTLITGGTIYDGLGGQGRVGDVAIKGDRIVYVGPRAPGTARDRIDATGLAVAPGFINMLSWAVQSLIEDGRGLSDIRQGVTLEVFGEGSTPGPINAAMKQEAVARQQGEAGYDIEWNTLGEYLDWLAKRGIAPNIASFVGAETVRTYVLGRDDVDPTSEQLQQMRALVAQAMREGAIGVGSALIYAPGNYAETPELIALTTEAGRCNGLYISHMRSEGDRLLESIDELIEIARKSGARGEIYHFKQAGKTNWNKIDAAIARVEAARASGLKISANMYPYTMGGSGLDAAMPTWVQSGGLDAWIGRMKDPKVRARIREEITKPGIGWENLYLATGPDRMIAMGFRSEKLKPLTGKTIAEIAAMLGTDPVDTMMDLVIEDGSRVGIIYNFMDEENVARATAIPWMSFGSDAAAVAAEGDTLKSPSHPRTYGTFARVVGRYARDQKLMPLGEVIRKMSSQPAENMAIKGRGRLAEGYFADVIMFDPETFIDRSTLEKPHVYAEGMRNVFVNGEPVLLNGEPTANRPGRVVRGPGWTGWPGGGACHSSGG
ncbi:N-acyl-D-amino-acid deacylase family protein [Sphingosinicella rhizophila]|uniref:D-aminoacylase n=1 Tax=Sphingosinicella rhizophila TaxID=3050082 RepID=A0ABU3Q7Q1_9SPHN|nr:D-aminoacylase [Sphingosinicella sp. GR2756]MDT9599426.1 D-aminoacylase [Sphingosinicella sp. GR2756]